ncbi:hypothetical protein ABTM61_19310, partial [Acinetobacter baumannii]
IRLVEEEGFALKTYPLFYSDERTDAQGNGPAVIRAFRPELCDARLVRKTDGWYAELERAGA